MELIHRNAIPNGIEKFEAFTDVQKLKAARRMDMFFAENPNLDSQPSRASAHRAFIRNNVARSKLPLSNCGAKGQSLFTGAALTS